MTDDERPDFTVTDKRLSNPENDAVNQETPQQTYDEVQDSQSSDSGEGKMPRLTMLDRFLMCIDILHQGAWIGMGLVTDPATGQIELDLTGARIAIDSLDVMAGKIQDQLDDNTRRELKTLLGNLKLNYVQQSTKQSS